jgi:hypothetical protein
MMQRRFLPALALILTLALSAGGWALAQEGSDPAAGPAYKQLGPEERKALEAMRRSHRQKVAPLRDQLWAKNKEYEAMAANPNTKPAEIKAIVSEMLKLKAELRQERESFFSQAQAQGFYPGPGFRRGHDYESGCGCGLGWDGPGRGEGPGRGHGQGHGRRHGHDWRD